MEFICKLQMEFRGSLSLLEERNIPAQDPPHGASTPTHMASFFQNLSRPLLAYLPFNWVIKQHSFFLPYRGPALYNFHSAPFLIGRMIVVVVVIKSIPDRKVSINSQRSTQGELFRSHIIMLHKHNWCCCLFTPVRPSRPPFGTIYRIQVNVSSGLRPCGRVKRTTQHDPKRERLSSSTPCL